jgi:hypothetical protein
MFYDRDEQLASRWDPGSWWLWHHGGGRHHTEDELKQMWDQGWTVEHIPLLGSEADNSHLKDEDEDEEEYGSTLPYQQLERRALHC